MHMNRWGGRRPGSGRKNRTRRVGHGARKFVTPFAPLHLTFRLKEGLPSLRNPKLQRMFRRYCRRATQLELRIVHYAVLSNHLHIIAEADSNQRVVSGVCSLAGRFGKLIRRHTWRAGLGPKRGSVFLGRYHVRHISSARQMRRTLKYVLLNFSRHAKMIEHLDPFSSARSFAYWPELLGDAFTSLIKYQWNEGLGFVSPWKTGVSPPVFFLSKTAWRYG